MKTLLLLISILSLQVSAQTRSSKAIPGAEGNGGAVINYNGRIVNFGSSSFAIKDQELYPQETDFILSKIQELHLDAEAWSEIYNIVSPSTRRKYYNTEVISDKNYQDLVAEYKQTYNIPSSETVLIAAVTNQDNKSTYILPVFYQMDFISRAALLLHESLWLHQVDTGEKEHKDYATRPVLRNLSLGEIVQIERDFEAFARCNQSCAKQHIRLMNSLLNIFPVKNKNRNMIEQAFKIDLNNNSLQGLIQSDNTIPLIYLFGERALYNIEQCSAYVRSPKNSFTVSVLREFGCSNSLESFKNEAKTFLFAQNQKYPNSFLFTALLNAMNVLDFKVTFKAMIETPNKADFINPQMLPFVKLSQSRIDFTTYNPDGFRLTSDQYKSNKAVCKEIKIIRRSSYINDYGQGTNKHIHCESPDKDYKRSLIINVH